MLWHWINLGIKLFLNLHHILLISLSDQIDSQTDLSITTTATDSMEVSTSFSWEIKVNNNINTWYINTSGNEIWTYKCFKFSFSETFKNLCSFFGFHTWMKVTIFILSFIKFFGQKFSSFIRSTKYNALVDDKFWINFVNSFHFISLI